LRGEAGRDKQSWRPWKGRSQAREFSKMLFISWVPMAHTYNPSYSGSRDQEDRGSKQAPGKLFERPYLKKKKTHHKKRGWWSKVVKVPAYKCEVLSSNPSATKYIYS
jgi:hypothetical protein